ncbi:MAG: carboxypeptidase-like regulatory domain-containing protein [Bacteroidota bacterium]
MSRCFALFSLLFTASASAAQEAPVDSTLGTLMGVVMDAETGEPLIGANVWLPELQRGVAADIEGRYEVTALPIGTHLVRISFAGYEVVEMSLNVRSGKVTQANTGLQPAVCGGVICDCFGNPLVPRDAYTRRLIVYRNYYRDPCACHCWTHERSSLPSER